MQIHRVPFKQINRFFTYYRVLATSKGYILTNQLKHRGLLVSTNQAAASKREVGEVRPPLKNNKQNLRKNMFLVNIDFLKTKPRVCTGPCCFGGNVKMSFLTNKTPSKQHFNVKLRQRIATRWAQKRYKRPLFQWPKING